jgi:hypothetical protein
MRLEVPLEVRADYATRLEAAMRLQMHATDPASPGRWLVVIDSERSVRPPWAPAPPQRRHKPAAQALASC